MKTEYQFNVISRVKKIREEKGMCQAELARKLGISRGQMGSIESYNATYKYTVKQLSTICRVLDTSMAQIFGMDGDISLNEFVDCLVKYQEKE